MLSDHSDIVSDHIVGTYVSLYSGAGGMDLGFTLAGFAPVWVNELNLDAIKSHDESFKMLFRKYPQLSSSWPVYSGSLLSIPRDQLPRVGPDLVIGGPPCQGFSVIGKMNPSDQRSDHVFHFMDMVDRIKPKAFIMENVKALFENKRWDSVRNKLMQHANALGYECKFFLCDSSQFGVPQVRERLFFIGALDRTPLDPIPTTKSASTVRQALRQLPKHGEPGNDGLCKANVVAAKNPVLRRSPYAGMMFNGAGRPLDLDAPALTLPASMGGNATPIIDQESLERNSEPWIISYHKHLVNGGRYHEKIPSRMRRITIQEAAALQTFPLDMKWCGSSSSVYRQIGNAVPPRLAFSVAEAVKRTLEIS